MSRLRKSQQEEPFISRADLIKKRGLTKDFIRDKLKAVEYDFGYRTKKYKLSEVDQHLAQMKAG